MSSRFPLTATVVALSLAACAPAEPPLLIDDTSSATVAGDGAPRVEMAASSPPASDEGQPLSR